MQPPRGCVLVTWAQADANGLRESSIIQEDKLVLLDRALLVADIVKKSPTDSMSGTVIRSNTRVTLMPPVQWPPATSQAGSATFDSPQGGLSFDPQTFLHDIPSHELRLTNTFEPGSFVVYGPWVGKIDSVDDEVTIRLGDGSLVVVEDIEELSPEQDSYYVNDFVHTKKANLRRGRWVFGTYNANVEPAGYVAQVRTISLEVEWLGAKWLSATTPGMAFHNQPPYELDQDILDSGHLTLYDESVTPAMISDTATASSTKVGLELAVGDRVRFKDLTGASVKYSTLKPIPRTETLGHDINTFVVQSTRSEVTVLWQDLTRTTCDSKELIPFLDIGEGEEVWPGEMIMTKTRKDLGEEMFAPDKFGVVQAVNSQERMAQVRWCTGEVVFSKSDAAPEDIMITNRAGAATGECEACSLYDITTLQVWERRVGDMVAIIPSEAESETQAGNDWFGEVVELGLDGLLTVRLGASTEPRDVMVPISRTAMLYSSDAHGGSDHGDEDDDDNSMSLDSDESMDRTHGRHAGMDEADVEWRDELDEIVAEDGDEGWTTEEDDLDLAMANNIDADMTDENTNGNTMKAPTASHETASVALTDSSTATLEAPEPAQSHRPDMTYAAVPKPSFSYSSMFPSPLPDASHPPVSDVPPNFDILDGTAPSSHHFSSSTARPEGPQLRRILKEHKILRSSLPDGVFVRTWEASLDLLRVLILGPLDTPYEYAPFVIDFSLEKFPQQAPQAFFHSWTDGTGPVNPNLYENGKICLSLLGTWPGDDKQETWTASKSTILQVLVSILGLVLVREPYYSESSPHPDEHDSNSAANVAQQQTKQATKFSPARSSRRSLPSSTLSVRTSKRAPSSRRRSTAPCPASSTSPRRCTSTSPPGGPVCSNARLSARGTLCSVARSPPTRRRASRR